MRNRRYIVAALFAFTSVPTLASAECCTPEVTAQLAAAAQFVDVAGVKLGMPADQVEAALAKANPAFQVSTELSTNWDFASLLTTDSSNDKSKQWRVSMRGQAANEQMTVGLSLPPNEQVAVTIHRSMYFPDQAQPAVDTLITSLRNKYGPESAGPDNDPLALLNIFGNRKLMWFFDANGKTLPGSAPLSQMVLRGSPCEPIATYIPNFRRFGNPNSAHGALVERPADGCYTGTVMLVTLACTAADNAVCQGMTVTVTNYPLYDNSEAATDGWIHKQRRAMIEGRQQQSSQVPGPKL